MRKDQAVAMQLGNTFVSIPCAEADNILRLKHHLDPVAIG
jgi:hypothetical protein